MGNSNEHHKPYLTLKSPNYVEKKCEYMMEKDLVEMHYVSNQYNGRAHFQAKQKIHPFPIDV